MMDFAMVEEYEDNHFREPRRRVEPFHGSADGFRLLEDPTFKEHFRMNRGLFERLVVLMGNHLSNMGRTERLKTPVDLSIMMAIWILATHDTFRSVAVKFAIPSRGTVHYHHVIIIEALRELAPRFIKWPDEFERDNIKAEFERKYDYPGVVGCLDGSHIYISKPLVQPDRYVNRFRKCSVLCKAVCDHSQLYRDIYVGERGSVHDSRMFQMSPLSHNLLHSPDMLSPGEHLLGDGAYTLLDKVVTPYRDNGNLSRRQKRHNYIHASAMSAIEGTFGLDRGLWRRHKLMAYSHVYLLDSMVATCVLHNFILLQGQAYHEEGQNLDSLVIALASAPRAEDDDPDDLDNDGQDGMLAEEDPALGPAKVAGRQKRDFIAFLLHPYD